MKIYESKGRAFQLDYKFGYVSQSKYKYGYRHFPVLWVACGRNGFTISILGLITTIGFKS